MLQSLVAQFGAVKREYRFPQLLLPQPTAVFMEDQAPHVLVVDDDADTCEVIKALLRSEGYQVTCTTSSVEGLALASKKCFDLILLDNWMPGLGGIPLCKSIRLLD